MGLYPKKILFCYFKLSWSYQEGGRPVLCRRAEVGPRDRPGKPGTSGRAGAGHGVWHRAGTAAASLGAFSWHRAKPRSIHGLLNPKGFHEKEIVGQYSLPHPRYKICRGLAVSALWDSAQRGAPFSSCSGRNPAHSSHPPGHARPLPAPPGRAGDNRQEF